MKKGIVFLILFILSGWMLAHEFWLQPERFMYQYADTVNIRFRVGENFDGENWKGNREKINTLQFWYGGVMDTLDDQLSSEQGDSLVFRVCHEGTCMATYSGVNSFISLDAAKFNAYLQEDGLTGALRYRQEHNETDSAGREYYQRSVKTIFQVGVKKDDGWRQATQLPVDILPLSNPYNITKTDSLRFKVFFKQLPLRNQLIKAWHKLKGRTTQTDIYTGENGELSLPVTPQGVWMLSTVHMLRLDNDPQAQWQSYWGSCTWGYE